MRAQVSLEGLIGILIILLVITFAFDALDGRIALLYDTEKEEELNSLCHRINFGVVEAAKFENITLNLTFRTRFNITAFPSLQLIFLNTEEKEVSCEIPFDSFKNETVEGNFNLSVTSLLQIRRIGNEVVFS